MLLCYTIDKSGVSEGIPEDAFDCILSDTPGPVMAAELRLVPTVDGLSGGLDDAQLCLAFAKKTDPKSRTPEHGALVSVDPSNWFPADGKCSAVLLDPCGNDSNALMYLPDDGSVLLRATAPGKPKVLSIPPGGNRPVLSLIQPAELALRAIGVTAEALFGAPEPVSPKALPKARRAASRKPAREARTP